MSFGYQSATQNAPNKNEFSTEEGPYGIKSPMVAGLSATRKAVGYSHPLEATLKNCEQTKLGLEMTILKNTQGLHAPMRLAMELKSASRIGRLPFLPSSFAMKDAILGRDEEIGPEDIFNIPEFREQMGQPHAVVEKSLRIL